LFSVTGDTILRNTGFEFQGKHSTTRWPIEQRAGSTDTLRTLSQWEVTKAETVYNWDSIPRDTLAKYHLSVPGRASYLDEEQGFRIELKERKVKRSHPLETDEDYRIASSTVRFAVYHHERLLTEQKALKTMYYSQNGAPIDVRDVVDIWGWKMEGAERYVVVVSHHKQVIENGAKSTWFYPQWYIL